MASLTAKLEDGRAAEAPSLNSVIKAEEIGDAHALISHLV